MPATTTRIRALTRLLLNSGDITPTGARMLNTVCDDEDQKQVTE